MSRRPDLLRQLLAEAIATAKAQGRESIFLRPEDALALLNAGHNSTAGVIKASLIRRWLSDEYGDGRLVWDYREAIEDRITAYLEAQP